MTLREVVNELLRDLWCEDEETVKDAVMQARHLLVWVNRSSKSQGVIPPGEEARLADLLGGEMPTEGDIDAITDALLKLLTGPNAVAAGACFALARARRPHAIQPLARFLRTHGVSNGHVCRQAVMAVYRLALVIVARGAKQTLLSEEERLIEEACSALDFAAQNAVQDMFDARDTALELRRSLSMQLAHIGRSC